MAKPRAVNAAARSARVALVTGFDPFGSHIVNPSALIARALNGTEIAGTRIVGRVLPVDLAGLDAAIDTALAGIKPRIVLALGLAASEPVIRLERVALNCADFNIPDNAGAIARGAKLEPKGPAARESRLPLDLILERLLAAGIPARFSETAGLYLCNAAMYRLLGRLPASLPCGFVHLPPLPAQIAALLQAHAGRAGERTPGLASMGLEMQQKAVEIALAATLGAAPRAAPAAG